jgi:hypothetical protein
MTVWVLSSEAAESGPGWPRWGSTTEDCHCVILSKKPQTDPKEDTSLAVVKSMDLVAAIREQLATTSPDVLRELLEAFVNALMSAEADAVCGAPYGEVSPERVNRRNGYRDRPFDTRVGSIELRIRKAQGAEATSPTGCLSAASGPRRLSPRWWPPTTCSGSLRGAWCAWPRRWGSRDFPSPRCRRCPRSSTASSSRSAPVRSTRAPTASCGRTPWS